MQRNTIQMTKQIVFTAAIAGVIAPLAGAAVITKANNTTALNNPASWVEGVVPGANDIAVWDATVTSGNTVSLGGNLSWQGVSFNGMGGNVVLNGAETLTLGAAGMELLSNRTVTWNTLTTLGADQTWNSTTGTFLIQNTVATGGNTLTLSGNGTKQFKNDLTGGGAIVVAGVSKWSNMGAAASDISIAGGALAFELNAGTKTRGKSLSVEGGSLAVTGVGGADTVEQFTNALTAVRGATTISLTPNAARNTRLTAASFSRDTGTVLFRGTALGANAAAGNTANASNITFGAAPSLEGAGAAGTSTVGILAGVLADTSASGSGLGSTGGFATYDTANGVRPLSGSEYTSSITSLQTQLDNVRYLNGSGTPVTTNLASGTTTINSLSIVSSGAGNIGGGGQGVTLSGDAGSTLRISSGMLLGSTGQVSGTVAAADAIVISTPTLDFNGKQGVVFVSTAGVSNNNSNAVTRISGVIANADGLTKAGSGILVLSGGAANTYSGTTTMNEGVLTLGKTSGITAIPGDLVINGGRVQHAASNQIDNDADITINGGAYSLQFSNSGSSNSETFGSLTMNGGSYGTGASGHSGSSTISGAATIAGGSISQQRQTQFTVNGLATFSGGTHSVGASASTTIGTYTTIAAFNGGLSLVNPAKGAYTPLTVSAGDSTRSGGRISLNSDLSFAGNATNTNTLTIAAAAGQNQGVVTLEGTRTFDIGDGAADADVTITPAILNGSTTGGLTKTGPGTLVLTGASTYTGPTNINAGTLVVGDGASGSLGATAVTVGNSATLSGSGSIGGAVTVAAGGTLSPGNSPGILDSNGLSLDALSAYVVELNGTAVGSQYDQTYVTGSVAVNGNLVASLGYAPTLGDKLFIINNDGSDAVLGGGFANLLAGNLITLSYQSASYQFEVSYQGDFGTDAATGGNDVVLVSVVPEPAALSLLGLGAVGLLMRRRNIS